MTSFSIVFFLPLTFLFSFASISPPFSGHFLSLPLFHLPVFHMTRLLINFFLELSFTPTSTVILFHKCSLISSLNSHDYSYEVGFFFSQTWTFSCCFSVNAIISSAFMYAGVTHQLSTFPLRLRDICPSPITPTRQAFASAVILVVT